MILDSEEQRNALLAVVRGSQVQGPMYEAKKQMEFLLKLEDEISKAKVDNKETK